MYVRALMRLEDVVLVFSGHESILSLSMVSITHTQHGLEVDDSPDISPEGQE